MDRVSYYLYGSGARGDKSEDSDVDVLVVCDNPKVFDRRTMPVSVLQLSPAGPIDLSVYGFSRLREIYSAGHLFAWHLYGESQLLAGGADHLAALGEPAAYTRFGEETGQLLLLLESVGEQIEVAPNNLIYEAGIAYVCVRNIAMAASYFRPDGPDFSPFAPFHGRLNGGEFPLSKVEYSWLRSARLSGTRGYAAPELDITRFREILEKLLNWAGIVIDRGDKCYETSVC